MADCQILGLAYTKKTTSQAIGPQAVTRLLIPPPQGVLSENLDGGVRHTP